MDLAPRAVLAKRQLSKGGIAGVVVGVCVAVALALCFLYPVVIRRIIRRRRQQRRDKEKQDAEAGQIPSPGQSAGTDHERRVSSQDSFKPSDDLARGGVDTSSVKDVAWTPVDGIARSDSQRLDQVPRSVPIDNNVQPRFTQPIRSESQITAFTGYEEEFVPESIINTRDGTLNGTSADYYNPQVPDSAFGMTEEPQAQPDPERSLSRGSSLRHNLKQMFSRKSTRDQTSPTSPIFGESFDFNNRNISFSQDAPLQRITTAEVTTESPTDIHPPASDMLPPSDSQALGSPINLPVKQNSDATQHVHTPPQSPPEFKFASSASPPTHPAPGTVNPMDIMPAMTQSEQWHRTEHQLYMSYTQSSPTTLPPSDQPPPEVPTDSPSPFTLPPSFPIAIATPIVQTPTPTQEYASFKQEPLDEVDVAMVEIPSHNHLTPAPERDARHQSYHSDVSTPFPGPASTNASTLNTPATQLDTPSPNSEGTSDYNHSVSPHSGSNLSPRTGGFPCNEPGCGQVFDQPHKLKHHQRYHTKEHKCTYPNCGKGFGTKTHLQRHINDRHEKKKKFHCAVQGCDYSRQGGKGFPRKDNWKRHMTKIHNLDQRFLPEPDEVDSDMTGV
ncbi:hypothetical protein B0T10DRAFT_68629 [Thelonectria olida]|uniref:C2H2-type domain-containing protein n=1 Tax=Thelonectria olida TaxID=1576542 RepID=A0A9P8W346_9HYPO|nr:hypothetical protein B0T10DRAFT_68629 [Thelonectria olida]